MTYSTKEAAKAKKKLEDTLVDLYISCKTFNEFRSKALQLHSYRCHMLDPYWKAYMMILHPFTYWMLTHLLVLAFSSIWITALVMITGCYGCILVIPFVYIPSFFSYVHIFGHRAISRILLKEGISSNLY